MNTPIPESYWLVDGMLLAGGYPGASDEQEARERLGRFLDAGIRTFIDLTESSEPLEKYDGLLQALAAERKLEAKHLRHGIRDLGVPEHRTHMKEILATMRDEIAAGRAVYVHCWGGIGRTGTVIGCWLVEEGLAGPAAIEKIAQLRAGTRDAWIRSPQTAEQCSFICDWLDGD